MKEELFVIEKNIIWELVDQPREKKIIKFNGSLEES